MIVNIYSDIEHSTAVEMAAEISKRESQKYGEKSTHTLDRRLQPAPSPMG